MPKYIHNISDSNKTYQGREILAGSFFQISDYMLSEYASDAQLISDLANSIVKMSANGTSSLSGTASQQVDFLKSMDMSPRDSDGVPYAKTKITTTGWAYQLHGLEFETSNLSSIYSKKYDGSDFGFCVIKCFKDSSGALVECADQSDADLNCIVTQLDWHPTHDYEIVGGVFKQLALPNDDLRLWVVAVPDLPAASGGSKVFATNINLKYMGLEEGVKVDGRAPKYLTYSGAPYYTNKLRLILKHPAGLKHKAHMIFEIFKS